MEASHRPDAGWAPATSSKANPGQFGPTEKSQRHSGPKEDKQRIRVAIIGAGRRAREQFAPAIFQNTAFHLRAVWSRTQASAARFNLEVAGRSLEVFHGEEGLQNLIDRGDIVALVVALPVTVQATYVDRLLKHRRHVLSEAPVALDTTTATAILKRYEESKESGHVWMVSSPLRFEPVFLPSSLRLETIGTLLAGELYGVLVVDPMQASEGPPRSDESLFIESGVQHIGVLQQIFGNIIEVNCIRVCMPPGLTAEEIAADREESTTPARPLFWEDALSGVVRFDRGGACAVNWQTSANEEDRRFRLSLFGARGSITIEQEVGSQAASSGIVRYVVTRSPVGTCLARSGSTGRPPSTVASVSSGARRQLEAWGRAINISKGGTGDVEQVVEEPTSTWNAPGHGIVDVIVLNAMLQSRGATVFITRSQDWAVAK